MAQEEAKVCMGAVEWPCGARFEYLSPYGGGGRTPGEALCGVWRSEVAGLRVEGPVEGAFLEGVNSTKGVWYQIDSIDLESKEEWLARRRAERLESDLGI